MELPFLYQTRTILRLKPRHSMGLPSARRRHQSTNQAATQPRAELDETSFFRKKAAEVAAKSERRDPSSITLFEQKAFENLRRLAGQKELNARLGISPEPDRLDVNPDNILALFTPQRHPRAPSADTDADASETSSDAPEQAARTAEAERIIREICHTELRTLASTFREALRSDTQPGDAALWAVLETSVFPLLGLLKQYAPLRQARPTNAPRTHAAVKAANAALEAERAAAAKVLPLSNYVERLASDKANPPSVPPLQVLSRYYPAALLLALRLLTKHHPLSLQTHRLLPHLRSLGPSSYILGATTPFYNTYLFLRWSAYSSLSEVCSVLGEMERGAVEFDRGTYRFLTDLVDERGADLTVMQMQDDGGAVSDAARVREPAWWLLPEQMRWWPKVEEWRATIARGLEERGMGEVLREGPGGVAEEDEVAPKVWL
ncbi:uncharacterized protein HMPREF1541_00794 [Cyphellophora europaea CBS 101466]|uniref:Mtf2-like C-terminal domain-containing protein n=1 Tax=Cyphellophora europaea (strain CBS 101466) TaxID=1220924 RepID=W2SEZ7_CYPE1|nr:uncharacterized protein HMPREF1541_00794 [Cyphellophora europaea CBS 101466]ETN46608.1 hypothetical protein HMPREF1541_00794 [Cyphellophora europaea CBS 101466]